MSVKAWLARLCDIPNAIRVLEIMDSTGVDIEKVERPGFENSNYWRVVTKWYIPEEDAEDLRTIVTYSRQYKQRSKIWRWFFPEIRDGYRVKTYWYKK